MRPVLTAERVRLLERPFLDDGVPLMQRAAHVVAEVARGFDGDVLVVVGPGNNGGDGLFAAAELAVGRRVLLWLAAGRGHTAGLEAARSAGCAEVDAAGAVSALDGVGLVVDAFTGIGARPGLPDDVALLARAARDLDVPVLTVDLPSGLDADAGQVGESFHATRTVSFIAAKPCHVLQPAASRCGALMVADIGVPVPDDDLRLVDTADLVSWLPVPGPTDHKYSRGVVAFDTGSEAYPGAALLGIEGALHVGTGMVRYLGPAAPELVLGRRPSIVLAEGRAQTIVVGSGWGSPDPARMARAVDAGVPLVVDAEALQCLPDGEGRGWLLTPHAGELAQLLGIERADVESDPVQAARTAAARTGAAVLLKGACQVVAEPGGRATVALAGPGWTAQAGSGDVLAGICGALLASGLQAWQAGVVGASVQALAARRLPGPFPPERIAVEAAHVVAELTALRRRSGPRDDLDLDVHALR